MTPLAEVLPVSTRARLIALLLAIVMVAGLSPAVDTGSQLFRTSPESHAGASSPDQLGLPTRTIATSKTSDRLAAGPGVAETTIAQLSAALALPAGRWIDGWLPAEPADPRPRLHSPTLPRAPPSS